MLGVSTNNVQGLSPLARGNRLTLHNTIQHAGPIPARAGEPPLKLGNDRTRPGLSPLARGNRHAAAWVLMFAGPIPARAGEPNPRKSRITGFRAYPRSRGGTQRQQPHQLNK